MNLHYWVSPETSPAQACVEFRLIIGLNYGFAIIINMFLSDITESENLGQSLLTRLTRVGNIHSEMLWSRSTANKSHCIARRWRGRERERRSKWHALGDSNLQRPDESVQACSCRFMPHDVPSHECDLISTSRPPVSSQEYCSKVLDVRAFVQSSEGCGPTLSWNQLMLRAEMLQCCLQLHSASWWGCGALRCTEPLQMASQTSWRTFEHLRL